MTADETLDVGAADVVAASDDDLAEGDSLLDLHWRRFVSADGLRSIGLLLVALVVLVWPDRTDRVLGILVGLALAGVSATVAMEVVRRPERRDFRRILVVAVAGGFAASLITRPADSLTSIVQLCGLAAGAVAVIEVGRMARDRQPTAIGVARAAGSGVAAVLLVTQPEALLAGVTSIAAALVGVTGIIRLFADLPDADDGGPVGLRATLLGWIRYRPDMAEDRGVMYGKVFFEGPTSSVRFARFSALMVLAAVIASIGVVVESTAVVIGAMLIAPLMTPLMGTALSFAMGWPRRLRRCAGVAVAGVGMAILTGAVVGAVLPRAVDVTGNSEIVARTSPTIVDLAIAVAAGVAGAYALARRDVSDSLPGVAVAIALVPPLAVTGLAWEQHAWNEGNGALLLFLTNAVAILVAGGATMVLVGAVPLERVSAGQERLRTAIIGLLAFGGVVVLLLLLNGETIARSQLVRAGVEEALADWTDEHEQFRVIGRRTLSDGTIVVDLAGPGRPPELDDLLASLQDALGDDVDMRVTWVEQEQVVLGAD